MCLISENGVNGLGSASDIMSAHDDLIAWDDSFYVESVAIGYVCDHALDPLIL